MSPEDVLWVALRIFCITGCGASLLLLSSARFHQWDEWSLKTKDHWWALTMWVFGCFYGVIELLLSDISGGSRLIVISLAVALTLRALLRKGELRASASFPGKKEPE